MVELKESSATPREREGRLGNVEKREYGKTFISRGYEERALQETLFSFMCL